MIFSAASGKSMITFSSLMSSIVSSAWFKLINDQPTEVLEKITAGRAEAEFKEKHVYSLESYVHSRLQSRLQHIYHGKPCQSRLNPPVRDFGFGLCFSLHILRREHRVGRVLSFFCSRRNWDSPNPYPQASVLPPPVSGGRGSLAVREREWESPNSDEGTYTVVLFIYTYFVGERVKQFWVLTKIPFL